MSFWTSLEVRLEVSFLVRSLSQGQKLFVDYLSKCVTIFLTFRLRSTGIIDLESESNNLHSYLRGGVGIESKVALCRNCIEGLWPR